MELYFKLNEADKAKKIANEIADMADAELAYFSSLNRRFPAEGDYEKRVDYYLLSQLSAVATAHDQKDLAKDFETRLSKYIPSQK